ncbi:MAG: biotin-dependent carboxyltransferase family protein [Bacteroidota bacterium]
MSLRVIKSGLLETIQDLGRHGYSKWGVNPNGVMDRYAAQAANALVGNEFNEGVVEIHFPAFQIQFGRTALISLTGADFTPCINNKEVALWKPLMVKNGSTLSFKGKRWGNRCYLSVQGGLAITPWLGSQSTNLKISAGGMGRALRKGDQMILKDSYYELDSFLGNAYHVELPWRINADKIYGYANAVSFIEGNEWSWLTEASKQSVEAQEFSIESSSDRMACYLGHAPLHVQRQQELLSSAVVFGTLQLLPSGLLTVLMADHQTTGGYPRVGHVITAHLSKLAQLNPHDVFYLNKISIAEAEKMLFSLQQELQLIHRSCRERLQNFYEQHRHQL